MDASIKGTVRASDKDAQYDEKAKKLLGHKIILAYILVNTIDEFRGMNPKEVVNYIEGEPYISVVPVDSGMTNVKKKEGKRRDNSGKELEKEYNIPLENDIRKDVREMCNLSQGIREEAFEEGKEQKLIRIVTKMYEEKFPLEQIATIAEISVEKVKEIIG